MKSVKTALLVMFLIGSLSAQQGGGGGTDGGSGSGTVSGQANGVIPLATAPTTIGAQSHIDDGVTTAATITSTEPIVAPSFSTPQLTTPAVFQLRTGSGASNPTYYGGWEGPAAPVTGAYVLQFPNANPAGQSLSCAAPGSNVSACTWITPLTAVPTQYTKWECEPGLGDGLNAIPAGTYLQSTCYNGTGVTVTLTGLKCYIDGGSSSTLNAAGNTLGALLTGAVTCSTSFASGMQSANVALTAGDYIKFTFVGDGTAKQTTFVVTGTY